MSTGQYQEILEKASNSFMQELKYLPIAEFVDEYALVPAESAPAVLLHHADFLKIEDLHGYSERVHGELCPAYAL